MWSGLWRIGGGVPWRASDERLREEPTGADEREINNNRNDF